MSNPYLGEIRCFGFNFAPVGWAMCNGQLLPISQDTALFSLLGTTYGGNGTSNFALPNLQGQIPMHWGNGTGLSPTVIGEAQGTSTVTVTSSALPQHTHTLTAYVTAPGGAPERLASPDLATSYIGPSNPDAIYLTGPTAGQINTSFNPAVIGTTGSGLAHDNMQPYLVLNFCIALQGVFPSRN